ncbi:KRAB [Mytilus coruscus]|uniref:KRAB n=1 Tax=Mytilus coruscus TaxID=42192 RepID=A0A6J8E396_MYTCO|nr:KRAB [Mytilus coruscus]
MALVLNATKEFCTDRINPDSGGTVTDNSEPFSQQDSVPDREPGTYKCSFCSSNFSSLYHLQCHHVYKHSSIMNHGNKVHNIQPDSQPLDLKMAAFNSQRVGHDSTQFMEKPVVSESGALDLSTVRNRAVLEPKPEYNQVSSSVNNDVVESDNEDSDKLVIDTKYENTPENDHDEVYKTNQSNPPLSHHVENGKQNSYNGTYNPQSAHNKCETQRSSIRPENCTDIRTYDKVPSSERQPLDFRSKSPQRNNTHFPELSKPGDTSSYPPYYSSPMDNQSLLNMIPPMPNMGMLGNFPVPFGFSPYMMMPPNSFMPPATIGGMSEGRFPLPIDSFPNSINPTLPYNPNLNLQHSKEGPVRRNSGICDKSFIHRHHLTIHSRMHSTNKPYICKICKKEFAQTSHLYKHIRQHTEQPGVTEAMIHESLAPILDKLKQSGDSPISSPSIDSNDEKISDAVNNNIKRGMDSSEETHSGEITVENEMQLSESLKLEGPGAEVEDVSEEESELSSSVGEKTLKYVKEIPVNKEQKNVKSIGSKLCEQKINQTEPLQMLQPTHLGVTDILEKSLKEAENLFHQQRQYTEEGNTHNDLHDKKSEISSLSERRYLNSPNSGIPYDEQCLKESSLPRIPDYAPPYHENNSVNQDHNEEKKLNTSYHGDKIQEKCNETDRYSPISQSGDSLSEGDFRSRSNSASENLEPNYKPTSSALSPRIVSSENILKEQLIPKDNCLVEETKIEIVMPPKKRKRYASRQKKKSQDTVDMIEEQPADQSKYPQMIQPMAAEAQQMYFLQLQQMQMALAANVMAAQGMMMHSASEQMKNQRGIPNGYQHNSDANDLPLIRQNPSGTPLKTSLPFQFNITKDIGPLDYPRGSPIQNGSIMNHSIAKAGYL